MFNGPFFYDRFFFIAKWSLSFVLIRLQFEGGKLVHRVGVGWVNINDKHDKPPT